MFLQYASCTAVHAELVQRKTVIRGDAVSVVLTGSPGHATVSLDCSRDQEPNLGCGQHGQHCQHGQSGAQNDQWNYQRSTHEQPHDEASHGQIEDQQNQGRHN